VRKYDPGNGRFSTPDPLGLGAVKMGDPGTWNRFAYVQGDPVNYVDPTGLIAINVSPGICIPVLIDGIQVGCAGDDQCLGNSFAPAGSCLLWPAPPLPAKKLLALQCEANLYYRPVDHPVATVVGGTHSYWQVLVFDPNSNTVLVDEVISGGPNTVVDENGTSTTYLNIWVHSSYEGVDRPNAGKKWFGSGMSEANCTAVALMLEAARLWKNDNRQYGGPFAPNSNTVSNIVGMWGGFFPNPPPGGFGWTP
jgi:hypothetical protein